MEDHLKEKREVFLATGLIAAYLNKKYIDEASSMVLTNFDIRASDNEGRVVIRYMTEQEITNAEFEAMVEEAGKYLKRCL